MLKERVLYLGYPLNNLTTTKPILLDLLVTLPFGITLNWLFAIQPCVKRSLENTKHQYPNSSSDSSNILFLVFVLF